jgi:hypothetical protein
LLLLLLLFLLFWLSFRSAAKESTVAVAFAFAFLVVILRRSRRTCFTRITIDSPCAATSNSPPEPSANGATLYQPGATPQVSAHIKKNKG